MAKHVPLGEGTINDHEARLEKIEQAIAELKAGVLLDLTHAKADYAAEMTGVVEPATPKTPKKKPDKET